MKCGDDRTENILLRVRSCGPQVENFCTEVLAWCLDHSAEFRRAFLTHLAKRLPQANLDAQEKPSVSTQRAFHPAAEPEDDEDDQPAEPAGRFDLVLDQPSSWVIVVECKIAEAPRLRAQLQKYRKALRGSQFSGFPHKFLVTLTNSTELPQQENSAEIPDAHLTWSSIQQMAQTARNPPGKSARKPTEIVASWMCGQFADFLKQKGMAPMNVRSYEPHKFMQWMDGVRFLDELEEILLAAAKDPRLRPMLKNRVEKWSNKNAGRGISVFNKRASPHLEIGFGLTRDLDGKVPRFAVVVEAAKPKGWNKTTAKQYGQVDEYDGMVAIWHTIGPEMNGQAEKMKEWLVQTALFLVK